MQWARLERAHRLRALQRARAVQTHGGLGFLPFLGGQKAPKAPKAPPPPPPPDFIEKYGALGLAGIALMIGVFALLWRR